MNIVAYGSLLNVDSLEATILRRPCMHTWILKGWKRIFNAWPGGFNSFLNIMPSENDEIWVASFEVTNAELECLRAREGSGELVEVAPGQFAFVWKNVREWYPPALKSYVDVCTEGARQLGIGFWPGTVTPKIDDDSLVPRYNKIYRPWSEKGKRATRNLKIRRFLHLE